MQDPTPIRKCVCFDLSFSELKRSELRTLEEIASKYGCTTGCGLCEPYIQRMLQTGETEFAFTLEDEPHGTDA